MSYFPEDIPFMSKEELRENGIRIPKDATDTNVWNNSEIPNSSDAVSRQAAIDALNEYFARIGKLKRRGLTEGEKAISLDTVGTIKTLPSVQLEPQEGHWINGKCDLCGEHAPFWCMASTYHESNYCPNCGAKMKGER